jgi:hypothetical protein
MTPGPHQDRRAVSQSILSIGAVAAAPEAATRVSP